MFSQEGLFQEILERGRGQGITNQEAYNAFVDSLVQEKLQIGEMDSDQNLPGLTESLKDRWPDYQREIRLGSK